MTKINSNFKQMDIKKLPLQELKSLAFDEITRLHITQNNLRVIQDEIVRRQHSPLSKKSNKPPKK